jgi:hypothetical protein
LADDGTVLSGLLCEWAYDRIDPKREEEKVMKKLLKWFFIAAGVMILIPFVAIGLLLAWAEIDYRLSKPPEDVA